MGLYRPASLSRELASLALLRKDTSSYRIFHQPAAGNSGRSGSRTSVRSLLLKAKGEIDNAIRILEKVPSGVIETDRDRILTTQVKSHSNWANVIPVLIDLMTHAGCLKSHWPTTTGIGSKSCIGRYQDAGGRWKGSGKRFFRSLPPSPVTDNNLALICLRDGRFTRG